MSQENKAKKQGIRYNKGKLRWRNIPMFFIRPLVEVGEAGEKKYGTFNFLKGLSVLDSMDSLKRHLDKFEDPNLSDLDEETKLSHMSHVAWNALVIVYTMINRPDLDDRYKKEEK